MNRSRWIATFVALAAFTAAMAFAGGSENKGKFNFKKTCKPCHTKTAAGGEVTPLTKTQEQWQRYFKNAKHNKGSEALSKFMTPEQLTDVQTFLVNHAADSPQPETCGG
jgi:cytochrome c5